MVRKTLDLEIEVGRVRGALHGTCHVMSTLYAPLGRLFQAQGENCETISYIHQRLQNPKKLGRFELQNSTSIAEISHEGKFFQRQKIVIKVSQQYFGRPLRLCPFGCQAKTLLIQRCPGSVAKILCQIPVVS